MLGHRSIIYDTYALTTMEIGFRYIGNNEYISEVDGKDPIYIKGPEDRPSNRFAPTELLLFAMASCSSSDVLSILEKMKVNVKSYSCRVTAERNEEHPKVVKHANINYILEGDVPEDKVRRAVNLSLNRYCNVSILAIRGGADVRFSITINGKTVAFDEKPQPL